jgi:hypothetical protein
MMNMNDTNEVHLASLTNPHRCPECDELRRRLAEAEECSRRLIEVIRSVQKSLENLAGSR